MPGLHECTTSNALRLGEDLADLIRQIMMAMITMTTTAATTTPTMIRIILGLSPDKPANNVTRHYFQLNIVLSQSRSQDFFFYRAEGNFGQNGPRPSPAGPRARVVFLGRGGQPPHQLKCLDERCKLLQRGPGLRPGRQ